ncbi:hypothetical protein F511_32834 [Dorcoceras hygrometricum]|uniref:Uncharacterized protein n=1 Tax=Dorcoceras hygrometricum TaxID=472368 RepID=A0A2Z7D3T1_9LAMI|nr:hypothetical protein F511_32834 [Dorcoceras hygrometricum]
MSTGGSDDDVSSDQQLSRSARAGSALMKSTVTSAISRELQCNQQLNRGKLDTDFVSSFCCYGAYTYQTVTRICGESECSATESGESRPWRVCEIAPLKVLNNKSVHTYMKKNLGVRPAGETSMVSGATTSEQQPTADNLPSLTNKAEKEAGETMKLEKATVEKNKKKKEKIVPVVKKQKVVVNKTVEARSKAAPTTSTSDTSLDADSCLLAKAA